MRPLLGIKILITRDLHQAVLMISKLTELGAEVLCIPTIKIADPPDWNPFDTAAERWHDFDWLLYTSTNAVHQTMRRLSTLKSNLNPNNRVKVAVVGNQTADAVKSYGYSVDLIPEEFQAEGLVKELLEIGVAEKKVLIPRAVDGRDFLVNELEKAGAEVTVAPVYKNVVPNENSKELKQTVLQKMVDWVTFTSSSTAINFFQMLGDSIEPELLPKIASIGSITSKTLNDYGLNPQFTADPQNVDGIVHGIVKWENDYKLQCSNGR